MVNSESSLPTPVVSGVPQGSVVGPLLFLIYINNLTKINLHIDAKLTLYADNILNYSEDCIAIQEDIDRVASWSCANFLSLNKLVTRRRTSSVISSPLILEENLLEQVKS